MGPYGKKSTPTAGQETDFSNYSGQENLGQLVNFLAHPNVQPSRSSLLDEFRKEGMVPQAVVLDRVAPETQLCALPMPNKKQLS